MPVANTHTVGATMRVPDGTNDGAYMTSSGFEITRAAAQTIPASTDTAISFTAADTTDTDAFHDPATNASRITIPANLGGWYMLTGSVLFVSNSTGGRRVYWRKNGTTRLNDGSFSPAATTDREQESALVVKLTAGDYVELMVNTGSAAPDVSTAYASGVFLGA